MRSTPNSERRPREAGTIGSMDRNFIYGIIAVQLGYASPQQVMAAASALFVDGSKSMAELLVAHGVLTEESRRKLDGVVEDALRARGFEENAPLESLGGDLAVFASIGGSLVEPSTSSRAEPSGDESSHDSVAEGRSRVAWAQGNHQRPRCRA